MSEHRQFQVANCPKCATNSVMDLHGRKSVKCRRCDKVTNPTHWIIQAEFDDARDAREALMVIDADPGGHAPNVNFYVASRPKNQAERLVDLVTELVAANQEWGLADLTEEFENANCRSRLQAMRDAKLITLKTRGKDGSPNLYVFSKDAVSRVTEAVYGDQVPSVGE